MDIVGIVENFSFSISFQFTSIKPSWCDIDIILFRYTWVTFFIKISKYQFSLVSQGLSAWSKINFHQRQFPIIIDSNHSAHSIIESKYRRQRINPKYSSETNLCRVRVSQKWSVCTLSSIQTVATSPRSCHRDCYNHSQ